MAKQNQNLSSDDTQAEREAKLAAAAEREREAAAEAEEDRRKAAEKAQTEAEKEAARKPTAAHPQISTGSEPPPDLKHLDKTSQRPAETVKAGQSGQGVGGASRSSKLTRQQMEDVIKQGGSVMHKGVIVNNIAHLPPEADLVQGDEEAEKRVAAELHRQRDAIDAQLAKLRK